jgi:hypothetical protein
VPPLKLSVIGLVRHMTQMEHVYLSWGLGGGERSLRYGDDDYTGARSQQSMMTFGGISRKSRSRTGRSRCFRLWTHPGRATVDRSGRHS